MIKELTITDFQRHSKFKVTFDPLITTIIGPSDAGKSAILRALKWPLLNQPNGDGFIREGADNSISELKIDGHTITRQRGKKGNFYFLDGSEFKAFGSGVPDAIAAIANVSQINFQGQHDTVYWFGESAGEVSRQLNAVVDLGVIDEAMAAIAGRVSSYRSVAQISKDRFQKAKQKKLDLDWVVEADKEYVGVESLAYKLTQQTAQTVSLGALVQSIKDTTNQRETAIQQARDLREVGLLGQSARKVEQKIDALDSLLIEVKRQKKIADQPTPDISNLTEILEKCQKVVKRRRDLSTKLQSAKDQKAIVDRGFPNFSVLEQVFNSYLEVRRKRIALENMLTNAKGSKSIVDQSQQWATQCEDEFKEQTEGLCPICGGDLK